MTDKLTTDRRSFLKLASVGTASAAVAAVSTVSADAEVTKADGSAGYSETDHVKKVYELARF